VQDPWTPLKILRRIYRAAHSGNPKLFDSANEVVLPFVAEEERSALIGAYICLSYTTFSQFYLMNVLERLEDLSPVDVFLKPYSQLNERSSQILQWPLRRRVALRACNLAESITRSMSGSSCILSIVYFFGPVTEIAAHATLIINAATAISTVAENKVSDVILPFRRALLCAI
jgi:hypothetical protein